MNAQKTEKRKYGPGLNTALFKALGHPLRCAILFIASDREVSPTELAEELGEEFQKVYAQVRALADGEEPLLELVATDIRRGGEQHFYKATMKPVLDATAWEELPLMARQAASALIAGLVVGEISRSIETGDFDAHPHRIAVRRPLVVDEKGAAKIEEAAYAYDDACVEAEAESAERRSRTATMLSALFVFQRATG